MFDRFKHQISIEDIGLKGQKKIAQTKVMLIGAGGLGTYLASFLTSMGIGTLGIVDFDQIELSNLNRQILYSEQDIGKSKVSVLVKRLKMLNSEININPYLCKVENLEQEVLDQYDIVCDCTDNLHSRKKIDALCHVLNKPLIYGAIGAWEGYITVLHNENKISLNHIFSFESYSKHEILTCSNQGIINTTCAIAGSMQANEVLKIILGLKNKLDGYIMCFNSVQNVYKTFKILK